MRRTSRRLHRLDQRPIGALGCAPPPSGPRCPCRAGGRCPGGPRRRPPRSRDRGGAARAPACRVAHAGAGMHHQPGGLVEHEQVLVLEHDRRAAAPRARARPSRGAGSSTSTRSPVAQPLRGARRARRSRARGRRGSAPGAGYATGPSAPRQEAVQPLPRARRRHRADRSAPVMRPPGSRQRGRRWRRIAACSAERVRRAAGRATTR